MSRTALLTLTGLCVVLGATVWGASLQHTTLLDRACERNVYWEQCASDFFSALVLERGTTYAFDAFADSYRSDSEFSKRCHSITHAMGAAAYVLYEKNGVVAPSDAYAYCSFGFYHGLIETIVELTGNIALGRQFCDSLEGQITDGRSVLGACLHGFGHGIIDGTTPETRGSPQKIIEHGLRICEELAGNEEELYFCLSGIYNGLSFLYFDETHGLSADRDNVYDFCALQEKDLYRKACYRSFHALTARVFRGNFLQAARAIESIADTDAALYAMRGFASYYARTVPDPSADPLIVRSCYRLKSFLHEPCIEGFVSGFVIFATPGSGAERALSFCASPLLEPHDTEACYKHLVYSVRLQDGTVVGDDICSVIQPEYRPTPLCRM